MPWMIYAFLIEILYLFYMLYVFLQVADKSSSNSGGSSYRSINMWMIRGMVGQPS